MTDQELDGSGIGMGLGTMVERENGFVGRDCQDVHLLVGLGFQLARKEHALQHLPRNAAQDRHLKRGSPQLIHAKELSDCSLRRKLPDAR